MTFDEEAIAFTEARARILWDDRERGFPRFTRMTWEDGSRPAKYQALCVAQAQLIDEGMILVGAEGVRLSPSARKALEIAK